MIRRHAWTKAGPPPSLCLLCRHRLITRSPSLSRSYADDRSPSKPWGQRNVPPSSNTSASPRPEPLGGSSWGSSWGQRGGPKSANALLPHEEAVRNELLRSSRTKPPDATSNASSDVATAASRARHNPGPTSAFPPTGPRESWLAKREPRRNALPDLQAQNGHKHLESPAFQKPPLGRVLPLGSAANSLQREPPPGENALRRPQNRWAAPRDSARQPREVWGSLKRKSGPMAQRQSPPEPTTVRPAPDALSINQVADNLIRVSPRIREQPSTEAEPGPAQSKEEFWGGLQERFPDAARSSLHGSGVSKDEFATHFWGANKPPIDTKSPESVEMAAKDHNWDWVDEETRTVGTNDPRNNAATSKPSRDTDPKQRKPFDRNAGRRSDRLGLGSVDSLETRKVKRPAQHRRQIVSDEDEYDAEAAEERRKRKAERRAKKEEERAMKETGPPSILLPEFISVINLGDALGIAKRDFLVALEELGFEGINSESIMTGETAALIAQEYGYEPTVRSGATVDLKPRPAPEDPSLLPPRPPVVTIMGHVDHGKTTILDWLRKSSIAAQEHGGITQHIGAFSVKLSTGKQITFLDTPGHAAFLTMRQRGANVTDIVILVVAADDSVKPQTLEALKHARAAKVPVIVAINKVDKDEANIDNVKADLGRHGVEIEDYGGDVQVVCVSGKTGKGMTDLEENILTLSEILDMRAETDGMAEGWVLEASIKPIGKVATVLVKRGTLRKGDFIVAGSSWAKIRVLRNEAGVDIDEAPPGTPVEILGWREPPSSGDAVLQAPDEDKARNAIKYREGIREREKALAEMAAQDKLRREREAAEAATEGDHSSPLAETDEAGTKLVNFIVKGDVVGSVEAVCAATLEVGNNEVRARILRSSAGQISEFDVEHAATSSSYIINFNNDIMGHIKGLAEEKGVQILDHTVIYRLTDDVKDRLSELLAPNISTRVLGDAEVLQTFNFNVTGRVYKKVAGCRVRNGLVSRGVRCRVIRKGETIFDGKLDSLKHGRKDASEMRKGGECGILFNEWEDFEVGDQVQTYEEISEKRHL